MYRMYVHVDVCGHVVSPFAVPHVTLNIPVEPRNANLPRPDPCRRPGSHVVIVDLCDTT